MKLCYEYNLVVQMSLVDTVSIAIFIVILIAIPFFHIAPEIISAEALSPVEILLEWSNMTSQDLLGYKVMYRNLDSNGTQLNITLGEKSTSLKLENLAPASNYSIQVAFVLVDSLGKLSDPLFVVTEGEYIVTAHDNKSLMIFKNTYLKLQIITIKIDLNV